MTLAISSPLEPVGWVSRELMGSVTATCHVVESLALVRLQ